jgi:hypothetical protein
MTNITTHDLDFSKINLRKDSFIKRLDMISFRDHRGSFENALVISAFYNKNLYPIYLDVSVLLDGKPTRLHVNKYNIVERKRLVSARTPERFSRLKRLFSTQPSIEVGDFVIDSNNQLYAVYDPKCRDGVFVIPTDDPTRAKTIKEGELQIVKSVILEFAQLENIHMTYGLN